MECMTTMLTPTASRLETVLDPNRLALPGKLPVARIHAREGVDHSGEPSLFVTVVFAAEVSDAGFDGETLSAIARIIHDRLLEEGIELFPYVTFITAADVGSLPPRRRERTLEGVPPA